MAASNLAPLNLKLLLVTLALARIDADRFDHGGPLTPIPRWHYVAQFNPNAETVDPSYEPPNTGIFFTSPSSAAFNQTWQSDTNFTMTTTREPFLVIGKVFRLNFFNLFKLGRFFAFTVPRN